MSSGNTWGNERFGRWWLFAIAFLLGAIVSGGGILAWQHTSRSHGAEIALAASEVPIATLYVSGAVANEGIYTFTQDARLEDVFRTAGGLTETADLSGIMAHVPTTGENPQTQPQRININTAEAWLLKALPGIGDIRAQAIIAYRAANGPFNSVDELLMVVGIGPLTLEAIRDKITVV